MKNNQVSSASLWNKCGKLKTWVFVRDFITRNFRLTEQKLCQEKHLNSQSKWRKKSNFRNRSNSL